MNIRYFEKNGVWWIDIRSGGNRKRVSTGTPDRTLAERAAPGLVAEALAGFSVPKPATKATVPPVGQPEGPTVDAAFKLGMKTREQWITSKDKKTLEQTRDHLGIDTATFRVAGFTRDKVRELRAEWVKAPGKKKGTTLSHSTINSRLSMISVLLEVCDLPPHGVKHLSVKGTRRTRRMPEQEIKAVQSWLFANARLQGALTLADMITVAVETCAREGELLQLQPGDIRGDTVTFRDTKNSESRTVPLPKASQRILEARRGLPGGPFADLSVSQLQNLWTQARAALGLAEDDEFVFHTLRHEGLSRLADAEANPFTMKAIAGHSNITTTQIYVSSSEQAMRRAQEKVEQQAILGTMPEVGRMQ
jgi:integrase